MAFDKDTRNQLAALVTQCRRLLTEEFTKQCQSSYGIRADGSVVPMEELTHLSDHDLGTARQLRERIAYLVANDTNATTELAIDRMLREQAFTVMNRLAAMRMAEARGLIIESVSKGMESQGFEMYDSLGGAAMGERFDRYQSYLYSMFDELAIDLGVLFDRYSPHGLLFPRETALKEFLDLLNQKAMEGIWAEDETIGWIYQYWNSKEERKAMRDASAAPRNSRELAVRNQFFTPRYVVEFLTDNTLGRIWYEMTKGQTRLADQCRYLVRRPTEIFLDNGEDAPDPPETDTEETLSQEELLKQPVHIPHRPVKDPREIRLLDPACGSMHFGLYAFDLFEAIYEEAWDKGFCPALQEAYPEKADYLRDVPRLIIEHNIHGVDIDPRAVQIAGLSLWLRAQKTWKDTPAAERPRVRRSNIVCAEPMPGSDAMLEDFVQTLDPPLLGELVKTVFDKMQLAGEAGTLLKIEEEIRTAIDDAKEKWENSGEELPGLEADPGNSDLRSLTFDFWDSAEERIYAALRDYAESAEAGDYQRRLFAEDAAHGFAFIDLCRKRYEAVVMNPPFGEASKKIKASYLKNAYPLSESNLAITFCERALEMCTDNSCTAYIADKSIIIRNSYEDWRRGILLSNTVNWIVNTGWDVLDANVETHLSIIQKGTSPLNQVSLVDVSQSNDKCIDLYEAVNAGAELQSQSLFEKTPNAVVFFGVPYNISQLFDNDTLDPCFADVRIGTSPGDSFRFYRYYWELPLKNSGWLTVWNGGEFSPFFRESYFTINWKDNGKEIINLKDEKGKLLSRPQNLDFIGRPGLSYGKRGNFINPAIMNSGCSFTDEGQIIIPLEKDNSWFLLAYINSKISRCLVNLYCGQHKHSGYVRKIPIPKAIITVHRELAELAKSSFQATYEIRVQIAEHRLFSASLSIQESLASTHATQSQAYDENLETLNSCIDQINEKVNSTVDLDNSALDFLDKSLESMPAPKDSIPAHIFKLDDFVRQLLELSLGTAFGRWDIRYANGERQPPELPDPFDPLPVFPPGMLQNADGLPAAPADVPDDYPLDITWPGILVDDEGHKSKDDGKCYDIVARVGDALAVIWGDRSAAIEQEACEILGVRTLRGYFAEKKSGGKFFKDHLKRYSKSRRQAPIYWPLSTESGTYTLWLYYHRLDDQTLYSCIANFVVPKIEQIENDLSRLQQLQQAGQTDAQTSNEVAKLNDLLKELRNFQDELKRLAPIWKPNLNDGVQITAAPLWPLFRNKTWQKKLKETWTKLEKGDYDWAHLAYSIWPDRVREKCIKDKSLAIAHDLEDLYVEPPAKKKAKKK